MNATYTTSLEKGLEYEAEVFAKLAVSPISKSLINIYELNEEAKKTKPTGKQPLIKSTGVVGAGIMGGGIAWLFSKQDYSVKLKDVAWQPISKAMQQIVKIYAFLQKRRRYLAIEVENKLHKVSYCLEYEGFNSLDVVVEAVPENLELKQSILAELEKEVSSSCLLVTNTSSIPIGQIAMSLKRPRNFLGMHFFNPVNRMPLVEIIAGEKTSQKSVETITSLAFNCGKTPILVKDSAGFLVNRILLPFINEAGYLVEEGVAIAKVDKTLLDFGMPMGALYLLDEVGIDVGYKVCQTLSEAFGKRMTICPLLKKVYDKKLLGKKGGGGFYTYDKRGKKTGANQEINLLVGKKKELSSDQIINRCLYIMINEAAFCLEEEVVASAKLLDLAMILGTGFPPFLGGLLYYADSIGLDKIHKKLLQYKKECGLRFKPAPLLAKLAKQKQEFYS